MSTAATESEKKLDAEVSQGKKHTLLIFDLVGEHCGLEAEFVQTIVHVPPRITRVPNAPAHISGVINLRGTVVPVLDCGIKMGMGQMVRSSETRVVVAEVEGIDFGFFVDAVREVRVVDDSIIDHNAAGAGEIQTRYINGVAKLDDGRLVVLLDLNTLFDIDELVDEQS